MPAATATLLEPMDDYAERLLKSREFGAAHRANVEASIAQQEAELEALRNDHAVLRAVIQHQSSTPIDNNLPVSSATSRVLGADRICPVIALALLEIIAMRRNILYINPQERGSLLENVMALTELNWMNNQQEARFDQLEHLHTAWGEAEASISRYYDASSNSRQPPRRCSRCQKVKLAGSGHGRSACDDGIAVSLSVPYPATSPVAVLSDVATDVSE